MNPNCKLVAESTSGGLEGTVSPDGKGGNNIRFSLDTIERLKDTLQKTACELCNGCNHFEIDKPTPILEGDNFVGVHIVQ